MITPSEKSFDGTVVYNFLLAATDIRKACEELGIDMAKQVTCIMMMMGENVNHNK
jgi:hypothetical protein